MSEELRVEVPASAAGRKALGLIGDALPDVATFALKALFEQSLVERDGHPCGPGQTLQGGEVLSAEGMGGGDRGPGAVIAVLTAVAHRVV